MADAKLNIILGLVDKASKGLKTTIGSFTELSSVIGLAGRAFDILKGAFDQTVGQYQEYAQEVKKVSYAVGLTAEETSRLIQVSDDFGVSQAEMTTALEWGVKNGFQPSIENLAALSDKYNEMENPLDQAAMLTKIFGRNWNSLVPLLKQGGDAIRDGAAAIDDSLVVTEQGIKESEDYRMAVDTLSDSFTGFKNTIGKEVLPVLADLLSAWGAATAIQKHTKEVDKGAKGWWNYSKAQARVWFTGATWEDLLEEQNAEIAQQNALNRQAVDGHDLLAQANARVVTSTLAETEALMDVLAADWDVAAAEQVLAEKEWALVEAAEDAAATQRILAASLSGNIKSAIEDYTDTVTDLKDEETDLNVQIAEATEKYGANSAEVAELTQKLKDNKEAQKEAKEAMKLTTAEAIYQQAAVGLDAQAALDLAYNMGLVSEADYAVASAIEAVKTAFDTNGNGIISAEEGENTEGYAGAIEAVTGAVTALETSGVPVTMETLGAAITNQNLEVQKADTAKMDAIAAGWDNIGSAQDALNLIDEDLNPNLQTQITLTDGLKEASRLAIPKLDGFTASAGNMVKPVDTAAESVRGLASAISSLQSKTVTITMNVVEGDAGQKKLGGPVMQGKAYLVGEAGPELFVPNTSGEIVPNNKLNWTNGNQISGGGSVNLTQNIYNPGAYALARADVARLTSQRVNTFMGG